MKRLRLLVVVALLFPLLALNGPAARANPSTYCTDEAPGAEIGQEIVNVGGVFLAVLVWPFTPLDGDPLIVGLCYRIPGVAGGGIFVQQDDGLSVGLPLSASARLSLRCEPDGGYPNSIGCLGSPMQLGGAGVVVHSPVTSIPGLASGPPCIIGGICVPTPTGQLAVATRLAELTVYLPLGGSLWVPVDLPIPGGCVINFSGPC